MTDQAKPIDDKAHIRDHLDLTTAQWKRVEREDHPVANPLEIAFVPHTDGITYIALRHRIDDQETILIYTPSEWEAFIEGTKDGEFDFTN